MQKVKFMFLKGVFYFILGVAFATLFVWSMVQGILVHTTMTTKGDEIAFLYYFAAWLAGIGGLVLGIQARQLIHYASISE